MNLTKDISNKIKIFSFIMTCVIVIYHAPTYDSSLAISSLDESLNGLFIQIIYYGAVIAMAYFFSVTGFLLFNNLNKDTYIRKMKSRVFTLLIPYVLWQLIFTLKMILTGQFSNSVSWLIKHIFLGSGFPVDGPLWYVYAVFFLALLSPILMVVFKDKKIGFICVLILCVFSLSINALPIQIIQRVLSHGYIRNVFNYLPAYLLGAFYGRFHDEMKGKEYLIYMLVICIAGIVFYKVNIDTPIICLVLPMLCLFELPPVKNFKDLFLFKLSFLMYAIHEPFIFDIDDAFILALSKLNISATVCTILLKVICLALVVLIAWLAYTILNKYSKKTLALLTGGRK